MDGKPWLRPGLAEELKRDAEAKEVLRQEYAELWEDRHAAQLEATCCVEAAYVSRVERSYG